MDRAKQPDYRSSFGEKEEEEVLEEAEEAPVKIEEDTPAEPKEDNFGKGLF